MATKEEKSEQINEILGSDLDWSRLLEDDLDEFHKMLTNGEALERLIKHMMKEMSSESVENIIDSWYPGKYASEVI